MFEKEKLISDIYKTLNAPVCEVLCYTADNPFKRISTWLRYSCM